MESTEYEEYRTPGVRILARGTAIFTSTEYEEYGVRRVRKFVWASLLITSKRLGSKILRSNESGKIWSKSILMMRLLSWQRIEDLNLTERWFQIPIMNHFSGVFHHSLSLINWKSVQRNPDFLMRSFVNTERPFNNNVSLAADNKTT